MKETIYEMHKAKFVKESEGFPIHYMKKDKVMKQ